MKVTVEEKAKAFLTKKGKEDAYVYVKGCSS